MRYLIHLALLIIILNDTYSQSSLTIPQIMQGQKFTGYWPSNVFWSADSKKVYFNWNPEMEVVTSLHQVSTDDLSTITRVEPDIQKGLPGRRGISHSQDYNRKVYSRNGDLFLYNYLDDKTQRLTYTQQAEYDPSFGPEEQSILYKVDDIYYQWDLQTQQIRQLYTFKKKEKTIAKDSDQQLWLERDQLEYFEVLQDRKEREEAVETRNKLLEEDALFEIDRKGKSIRNLTISKDLSVLTYTLMESPKGTKRTQVPDYVNQDGYVHILNARSKVGTPLSTYTYWISHLGRDTTYPIKLDTIPGIRDKPAFLKEYHSDTTVYDDQYSTDRPVFLSGPFYNQSGTDNFVVIRSIDNKDRWIMRLDMESGLLELIDRQTDEAWIGGPGIGSWNFTSGSCGWLDDHTIWFQSEESGYSHLYQHDTQTRKTKALTSGTFEIRQAILSKDKKTFYITSNKEGPESQHFYHLPTAGGTLIRLTKEPGNHRVVVSPDERKLAILYSYSNQPWELFIQDNQPDATRTKVTESTTPEFRQYAWRDPQLIQFSARDGAEVNARLYQPSRRNRNRAAVIFVHGAGYLQNAHKWWSSYYREYMFHNFLVDQGYTVLDIDYRGSDGYGRDWRTGIYRHMGGKDLTDQIDGANYLIAEHAIDADRVGVYGGSYGGFITLMGLFTSPGTFACGAALRSVTDWAHYNHGYTSNILNTPVEDSIAYFKSSPIYHAEGLEDHLLMLHGMVDVNVQFQDVVRLSQRLIELQKDNWELAVFPKENHGFIEAASWTDEYKRIYNLFDKHLRKK